jgi:hypothetical protein
MARLPPAAVPRHLTPRYVRLTAQPWPARHSVSVMQPHVRQTEQGPPASRKPRSQLRPDNQARHAGPVSGVPHLDVDPPEGRRTRRSAPGRPANQHDCQPRRVGRELALRGSRHSPLRPLAAAITRDPPDLRGDISTPNSRRSRARMGVLRSGFASAGESGYVRRSWQLDLPAGSLRRLAPPSAPAGSWAAGPCETSDRNRSPRAARRPPWLPLWLIACPNGCGRLFTWMQSCRSLCVGSPTDRCRRADRRRVG